MTAEHPPPPRTGRLPDVAADRHAGEVGQVVAVLGPVDPTGPLWGPTDAHEHLMIAGGNVPERFPDILLDDVDAAARELDDVVAAGGRVVVEATPIGLGRRPRALADLARRTGVVIVAATGFHKDAYYPRDHWVRAAGIDRLTEHVVADLRDGIDGRDHAAPWREPTPVRAGVIKVATELHHITSLQRDMFAAAAAAHLVTGAPLTTHCEHGTHGIQQLEVLTGLGVATDAVSVGHVDKQPDPGYLRDVASAGAFCVFTNPGRIKYGPDSLWIELIAGLFEQGLGSQVLVGGDMAPRAMWRAHGGGPGIGWLFAGFLRRLRTQLGDAVADAVSVDNPGRALAWRPPSG